jgi:hypothetical protein
MAEPPLPDKILAEKATAKVGHPHPDVTISRFGRVDILG